MSKAKKEKKLQARAEKSRQRKHAKLADAFPYVVIIPHSCICCSSTMYFRSPQSARKAFLQAGLSSSTVMIDDAGQRHVDVDTTSGFLDGTGYTTIADQT